jgi:hypothetical protein
MLRDKMGPPRLRHWLLGLLTQADVLLTFDTVHAYAALTDLHEGTSQKTANRCS